MAVPPKLKACYLCPRTGVVLALLALFLIGNSLYLTFVKEDRALQLETLTGELDAYQTSLTLRTPKKARELPEEILTRPRYGGLLKSMLPHLKHVESVMLETVDIPPEEKKEAPLKRTVLTLSGVLSGDPAPLQSMNATLQKLQLETGCDIQLEEAKKQATDKPLAYRLTVDPACAQGEVP